MILIDVLREGAGVPGWRKVRLELRKGGRVLLGFDLAPFKESRVFTSDKKCELFAVQRANR